MNKHAKRCDECGLKFKRSGTRVLEVIVTVFFLIAKPLILISFFAFSPLNSLIKNGMNAIQDLFVQFAVLHFPMQIH